MVLFDKLKSKCPDSCKDIAKLLKYIYLIYSYGLNFSKILQKVINCLGLVLKTILTYIDKSLEMILSVIAFSLYIKEQTTDMLVYVLLLYTILSGIQILRQYEKPYLLIKTIKQMFKDGFLFVPLILIGILMIIFIYNI